MRKTVTVGLGFLLVVSMSIVFSSIGVSETIQEHMLYVGGFGPGNYTLIQDAVNNATVGTTIFVYNGTYHEQLVIQKSLMLHGEQTNSTIIDGDDNEFVVTLAADSITISGFTITHSGTKFPFAGIYVTSDHNTISRNILTDNFYGMQLLCGADYNLISENHIFHNRRCGVYFNHSSHNTLMGNIVEDHPVNGFGLYEFSNNNTLMNNTLLENGFTGVNIRESYNNHVVGNSFIRNHVGLHMPAPEYHTSECGNVFSDNGVSFEEERDTIAPTIVVYSVLVLFGFFILKKRYT